MAGTIATLGHSFVDTNREVSTGTFTTYFSTLFVNTDADPATTNHPAGFPHWILADTYDFTVTGGVAVSNTVAGLLHSTGTGDSNGNWFINQVFGNSWMGMTNKQVAMGGAADGTWNVQTPDVEFAYLPAAEKLAIRGILKGTLQDLPAGW